MTQKPSTLARIIALLIVVGISIYIFSIRDQARQLAIYGYPGIFGLAFLSYATVLLPAPGVAVIFTMGAVFNPIGVALAAGAGAALGEIFGYLAGYSGQAIIARSNLYDRLTQWMKANGALTILLLSAVPNPLFDIVGVIAGALKVRLTVFLFWCWIGETLKMLFFALAGSGILN